MAGAGRLLLMVGVAPGEALCRDLNRATEMGVFGDL